jgi:drug/metabolite transporter (DMT)-like permease
MGARPRPPAFNPGTPLDRDGVNLYHRLTEKEAYMLFRTISVLLVGLCLESVGNVMLRRGMKEVGEVVSFSIPALFGVFLKGITNLSVITGVTLDALFFGCLLIALSWMEVSVVLPLTAVGYVTTAITAKIILHEDITALRWAGTVLIVMGCIMVGKSATH